MEEIKININSADSLLMAINNVVRNTYNTKRYDDKKHDKTEKITQTVKKEWSNYIEAVLLSQILRNLNVTDKLTPNGKQLYNQLAAKAGKKDSYFINFKKSIETKSIGLYAKYTPSSRSKISTRTDYVSRKREYILSPEGGRKDAYSLTSSLMDSQSNLLEKFNKSSATMFLPDYNKIFSQTQEMLGSNLYGETQSFKSALEREGQPQISVAKLEEITRNVNYLNSKIVYINFTIENMNKRYFTPETKAVLNKFIKELELTSQNLTNEVIQLKEDYTKERVSISEKVYGKVDVNRLVALMALVDRKTDSKGNELSKEKLQEYEQELERASKENSIA